ncbi:MAG: peptidoglycan editing factor PgeF [Eubacterium sp.]|nr:peptidoglycan editing factor PgeF [Eubacterium sp.]
MDWKYAGNHKSTIVNEKDGVVFLTFPKLEAAGVRHGFSTRMGGVSSGHLSTMNLSFNRGDDPDKVYENFRRIGRAIGFNQDDLVLSAQEHHTNIRIVTASDKGDGILRPTIPDVDGLATDVPGVPLYTSYADCVPLLFYDPEGKVIAMAHSGWRGTVSRIGAKMVETLKSHYGCQPSDLIAAIGPSICQACYEVSQDVAQAFKAEFRQEEIPEILIDKGNGKYQLDLWKANELILTQAGILPGHLDVTDLCTCCNSSKLFSHRASHGKRGNMGCFMVLNKE